jgi:hypothetical protein
MDKTVLFASCDVQYFNKYAKAFVKSAIHHGNFVHVHIINPELGLQRIEHPMVTYSFEENAPTTREYYAINRFLVAPEILLNSQGEDFKMLILDIDCVIMGKVKLPDAAVGLFIREPFGGNEWELRGTRVAAGAVMYDSTAWLFAKRVENKIRTLPQYWFVDQVALAETMDEFELAINVHNFADDEHFMNWDFSEDNLKHSLILTAKGERKNWAEYRSLVEYYSNLDI